MRVHGARAHGVIAAVVTALLACGGHATSPSAAVTYATYGSAHFTFRYTPIDAATVAQTAALVEGQVARITTSLAVTAMPAVTVTLYADRAALQDAVRPSVGTLPSFASGLVTGPDQIHILSPNFSSAWTYERGVTAIVHEFAHTVSLRVSPTIANNPRWLWESVALYEAGQFVDPRGLAYMTAGQVASPVELNAIEDTRIYDVGHVIGAFVVANWGEAGLVALVRQNGSPSAVNLTADEFAQRWRTYLRTTYGL
jgi:hypothetical protein